MSFRTAASLILLALKEKPFKSLYNYKVLMLKRSNTSSFMPNSHVFPGGTVESADSNRKWLELINKIIPGSAETTFVDNENRPSVLRGKTGEFDKDVSMRITVLRETFEETGLFLCKKQDTNGNLWGQVLISPAGLSSWRTLVQKNPEAFLDMCEEYGCVPDIWALKLWSNWLTPGGFEKRFDTIFYTACLPDLSEAAADLTEIQQLAWHSPEKLMALNQQQQIWLPPPQVYEVSRILRFYMLEDFAEFACEREKKGCDQFSAIRFPTSEGLIFPLPGDLLYNSTEQTDRFAKLPFKETRCSQMHRLEIFKNGKCRVVVENVKPQHGHLLPLFQELESSHCCKANKYCR